MTDEVSKQRTALKLTDLYGCAPDAYCQSCKPFGDPKNIFTLAKTALAATVVDKARVQNPRLILINTGSVRFDIYKGPFTFDDSFIVSPFQDAFQYFPDVPYNLASV